MKNLLLLFAFFFMAGTATVSALDALPAAQAHNSASLTASTVVEHQKGGIFKKMAAKMAVKKMSKALGSDDDGKMIAILSYLTLIGFVVAIVLQMDKKTSLGGFHLGQVLGNSIFALVGSVLWVIPILGWIAGGVIAILALINWIAGLISAIGEKEKTMPIMGKKFDNWFGDLFN